MATKKQDNDFASLMKEDADIEITITGLVIDRAIDFISSNFEPIDVFSDKELQDWAESNGYVKE